MTYLNPHTHTKTHARVQTYMHAHSLSNALGGIHFSIKGGAHPVLITNSLLPQSTFHSSCSAKLPHPGKNFYCDRKTKTLTISDRVRTVDIVLNIFYLAWKAVFLLIFFNVFIICIIVILKCLHPGFFFLVTMLLVFVLV